MEIYNQFDPTALKQIRGQSNFVRLVSQNDVSIFEHSFQKEKNINACGLKYPLLWDYVQHYYTNDNYSKIKAKQVIKYYKNIIYDI